ncbi:MAG TPA: hypothetical protein VGI78_23355, partial [Acetobacteraceae bacterium]
DAPAAAEAAIAAANRGGVPVDAPSLRTSARVYIAYQRILQDANAADFGDLLLWPIARQLGWPVSDSRVVRSLREGTMSQVTLSDKGFIARRVM